MTLEELKQLIEEQEANLEYLKEEYEKIELNIKNTEIVLNILEERLKKETKAQ